MKSSKIFKFYDLYFKTTKIFETPQGESNTYLPWNRHFPGCYTSENTWWYEFSKIVNQAKQRFGAGTLE